ncbi:hypothetical protein COO60DRAFT_1560427 [Scenedesmus sp. NREL 46B-D3]|nr:hypothetical protein COO60DRAFT_1560427 [Scenedesmus sp. NREL 46B-D3]
MVLLLLLLSWSGQLMCAAVVEARGCVGTADTMPDWWARRLFFLWLHQAVKLEVQSMCKESLPCAPNNLWSTELPERK